MFEKLKRLFIQRKTAKSVAEEQLHYARIAAIEHLASAEHHQALANMYAERVSRLVAAGVAND